MANQKLSKRLSRAPLTPHQAASILDSVVEDLFEDIATLDELRGKLPFAATSKLWIVDNGRIKNATVQLMAAVDELRGLKADIEA